MFFFCHFVVTALPGLLKHPNNCVLGDEELNRPRLKWLFLSSSHIVDVRSVPSEEESGRDVSSRQRHGCHWRWHLPDPNKVCESWHQYIKQKCRKCQQAVWKRRERISGMTGLAVVWASAAACSLFPDCWGHLPPKACSVMLRHRDSSVGLISGSAPGTWHSVEKTQLVRYLQNTKERPQFHKTPNKLHISAPS